MKNLFYPVIITLLCAFASHKPDHVRKQPAFSIIPPGTVWLRDSLFIDQTEVRNLDYLEYLYWLKRFDTTNYSRMLPDTMVWRTGENYNEPYVEYYLRHPVYRDYPVVGISYEQAQAFCKWRSDRVNQFIWVALGKTNWDEIQSGGGKDFPQFVTYFLPTKKDWEYAASSGLDHAMFPYGYENVMGEKRIPVSNTKEFANLYHQPENYKRNGDDFAMNQRSDFPDPTTHVYFGKPNSFGIYNLLGNVSEIVQDTIVKGYNFLTYLDGTYSGKDGTFAPKYRDSLRDAYYQNDYKYNGAQQWLGFRCECRVNPSQFNSKDEKIVERLSKKDEKYIVRNAKFSKGAYKEEMKNR